MLVAVWMLDSPWFQLRWKDTFWKRKDKYFTYKWPDNVKHNIVILRSWTIFLFMKILQEEDDFVLRLNTNSPDCDFADAILIMEILTISKTAKPASPIPANLAMWSSTAPTLWPRLQNFLEFSSSCVDYLSAWPPKQDMRTERKSRKSQTCQKQWASD